MRLSARTFLVLSRVLSVLVLAAAVTGAESRTLHFLAPGFGLGE